MTRDEYIWALSVHDWDYDYSDDQRAWRRGLAERQALNAAQPKLDPDFTLWNEHAPARYHRLPMQQKPEE